MNNIQKNVTVAAAITGILALGLQVASSSVHAEQGNMEKCAGIVKAGMNDCKTASHECAGLSKVDKGPQEWVYLPKGTCKKIVGGTVK